MKALTLDITDMQCEGCTQIIWNAISRQRGVQVCNVSLEEGQAHVVFDESQTSEKVLGQAVEKAGYRATVKR